MSHKGQNLTCAPVCGHGLRERCKKVSVRSLKRGDDPHAAANLGQSKRRVGCALRCLPDKVSIGHYLFDFCCGLTKNARFRHLFSK